MLDFELEKEVLAAMIGDKECLDEGMITVKKQYFYDTVNRVIFDNLKKMYQNGEHIDMITVAQNMKDITKERDGIGWLIQKDAFFTKHTFSFLADKLNKLYRSRQLVALSEETIRNIESGDDIYNIIANVENKLYSISIQDDYLSDILTPEQQAEQMLDTIMSRADKKSNGGIQTGIAKLNIALNGGFLPGQLIILAAQTGKGKTCFSMNMMRDIAIYQKKSSLYINTEMSKEQMNIRWASILTYDSTITHSKIATGNLTDTEIKVIMQALDKMHNSGFYCVHIPDLTLNKLISTSRRFKSKIDAKIIVVDYVGRIETADRKLKEWQVFKEIAKRLKTLAQELQVTVIMVAQLNEDEKLEGAKAMENEADLFMRLRESTAEERKDTEERFNYVLSLDKNRDGRRIKIPLEFVGEKLIFKAY